MGVSQVSAEDTILVNVEERMCSFQDTETAIAGDMTFTATGIPGKEVKFNNNGAHGFNVFCNYKFGYKVSAEASHLTNSETPETINFTNDYQAEGAQGLWTGIVSGGDENAVLGATGAAKVIKSRSDMSSENGDDFSVAYKAYIGTSTPPGSYQGVVKYTVSPSPAPALASGMAMQNEDIAFYCGSTEVGTTVTLKDTRTDASYFVTKMSDGNCWMTQNLWLIPGETIKTAKGNDYTLPEDSTDYWDDTEYAVMTEGSHVDGMKDSSTRSGSYFNMMAAMAVDDWSEIEPGTVAPDSVCPQGWVLPSDTTYMALINAYDSLDDLNTLWNYDMEVGAYNNDSDVISFSSTGWWTSNSAHNGWGSRLVAVKDGRFGVSSLQSIGYTMPYVGHNVRCMLVGVK